MMRFRTLIALAALTLIAAAPVQAQGRHELGLEGGMSMPTGGFGDAANTGYNIGGQYQYMIMNYGVGAELAYHSWSGSDATNAAVAVTPGDGSKMDFSTWQYNAYGVWSMPTPTTTPYVKFGMGWYTPSAKLETPAVSSKTSDTNFGMSVGGGVDWNVPSGYQLGVGATYHRLKDSETDFFSVSARVMWPLKVGL